MRVGIYLDNGKVADADLTAPELGNPGIGGREFHAAALARYLEQLSEGRIEPVLYAQAGGRLPVARSAIVENVSGAIARARSDGCWAFVDSGSSKWLPEAIRLADQERMPFVYWAHITPSSGALRKAARSKYFRRLVCISEEQVDRIRDHPIGKRIAFIRNGFDIARYEPAVNVVKSGCQVCFIGNINKTKGFHVLARLWPRILDRVPEASLKVIGSASLYNRAQKLGAWGVAEEEYERQHLRPFLSAADGEPHSSVEFLGLVSAQKKVDVIRSSVVGVVNPSGASENSPSAALECQAAGTPVVSGANWGLLDTVVHGKTGLLAKTDDELVEFVCRLLEDPETAAEMGRLGVEYVKEEYDYGSAVTEWERVLNDAVEDHQARRIPPKPNLGYKLKWLRVASERVRRCAPVLWALPSMVELEDLRRLVRRKVRGWVRT